nr:DUF4973 domain-containing protein [Bacteroides ovatus]
MNIERFSIHRPGLWYTALEEDKYDFPKTVHISAVPLWKQLNIDFNLQGIDMLEKWVLPLTIVDDPSYNYKSHPRKNYAKSIVACNPIQ